jgi:hypothetical protein
VDVKGVFLALALVLGLLLPAPVAADADLEAAVASATGIVRTHDAELHQRAHQRVLQIVTDFDHCCLSEGEAEVVGWNAGFSDPVVTMVTGWLGSADHRDIIVDPAYTRIGCAETVAADRHWFACVLSVGQEDVPDSQTPVPDPQTPGTLPNTAIGGG